MNILLYSIQIIVLAAESANEQRILIGIAFWEANSCARFIRKPEDYSEKHIQFFSGGS